MHGPLCFSTTFGFEGLNHFVISNFHTTNSSRVVLQVVEAHQVLIDNTSTSQQDHRQYICGYRYRNNNKDYMLNKITKQILTINTNNKVQGLTFKSIEGKIVSSISPTDIVVPVISVSIDDGVQWIPVNYYTKLLM
jgi:hypothetical protein